VHHSITSSASWVTVHPGESLWLIAARRLATNGRRPRPAEIAADWPRWYAANRELVGADPALITPGQVLIAPGGTDQEDQP
jgi:nucleoid-associated protein YgaU